jgi:hypothetical protein
MRRVLIGLGVTLALTAPLQAKKKTKPPTSAQTSKKKDADRPPPPNDKGTNEGAQGRINATESAAQGADSAQFEHRP